MTEGTYEEITAGLPIDIGQIKKIADSCKNKVNEVVNFYDIVIKELNELTEATLLTKGVTEEARRKTKALMEANEAEQKFLEEEKKKLDADFERIRQQLDEETATFKESLNQMGSFKGLVKQMSTVAVDTAANTVIPVLALSGSASILASSMTSIESGFAVAGLLGTQALKTIATSKGNSNQQQVAEAATVGLEDQTMAGRAQELTGIVKTLKEKAFESDVKLNEMNLKDSQLIGTAKEKLDMQKTKINEYKESKMKGKLVKVCQRTGKLINGISKAYDNKDENVIDLYKECEELLVKCIKYGDAKTKDSLFKCPSPSLLKAARGISDKVSGSKSNLSESYIKEMHLKIELTKEQLRSTEKRAEELLERQLNMTRELHATLSNLSKFKEEKATQDEVLQQIGKGLVAFGQLKRQWTDLLHFFDGMANLVNTTIGPRLEQFVDVALTAEKQRQKSRALTNLMRQRLFAPAFEASKVAFIVEHLSNTYWMISDRHLMPIVTSFGEMIAMSNDNEIEAKQRQIEMQSRDTVEQIQELILQGHEQFSNSICERQKQLDASLQKHVPSLPEAEKKKIEELAHMAVRDQGEDGEDGDGDNGDVHYEEFDY